jgi:hypothetical protein
MLMEWLIFKIRVNNSNNNNNSSKCFLKYLILNKVYKIKELKEQIIIKMIRMNMKVVFFIYILIFLWFIYKN